MNSIRLLMVDDEIEFTNTIANRLKRRGLTPLTAENGEAGLALIGSQPFDVVVLDIKMPGMNGLECLEQIKHNYPNTEVILLTGHASTSDGVSGIKLGAFDYLTKPVEFEHLLEKIKQAYDKQQRFLEKAKEAEFREKMNRQLTATERLASLGTLATGVAHEINNPLAIIQEWAGWLKSIIEEEGESFPRQEDFSLALNKIETAIGRAKRITHQLLGMVQKESETVLEIQVSGLMNDVLQLVSREARNRNITLNTTLNDNTISFWSDPHLLRQIFLNLINNAIHATPPGGSITTAITQMGNEIQFLIKDTGEGIPEENLDKLFEPFFTTKPTGEGTGLGLFVSRRLVDKLGGKIEVESKVGQGTEFRVRLPIRHTINEDL